MLAGTAKEICDLILNCHPERSEGPAVVCDGKKRAMNLQTLSTARNPTGELDAAGVLLRHLIDYAGLFPPASLSMASAVANYDAYLQSRWNWILGRFIVPVARLGEFEEALAALPRAAGIESENWRLSALIGPDPVADEARIRDFNARVKTVTAGRRAVIQSVEAKVASPPEIARLSAILPPELETYCEIPATSAHDCIPAVARCGRRAKIRTGGETADKFPSPEIVVEFLRLCVHAGIAFKATAGLHHPLRSVHRLTDQSDSPLVTMHGFINVFLAAAFLQAGMGPALAIQLLEESASAAFQFASDGIGWRQHRLSLAEVTAARKNSAISFGSCSFTEPIDDLRALNLL
jgi:hypothetical protein